MFSVVLPAYNCERTIYDSMESVRLQSRRELIEEIIIVNDGSIDNTRTIVERYMQDHKEINIILLSQSNSGVSAARNKGIRKAKAEWIAFIDSDDTWTVDKLEKLEKEISANPNITFLGSSYPLKLYNRTYYCGLHKLSAKHLCYRNVPTTPSVVLKREIGINLGLFNENMGWGEDINFFQRFLREDSYYVLADDLVRISIGKRFFAESGLTSNLKEMHKGRNRNTIELFEDGLISKRFMYLMLLFNQLKYFRRCILVNVEKFCNPIGKKGKNMFSVIIPAYNCEDTISMSLDSVLQQTRKDLIEEVLVINDGSKDGTEDVISKYIETHSDINISLINQENHGCSYARNVGIKRAKGTWIALLDSDDVWKPNKLERQAEILGGGQ